MKSLPNLLKLSRSRDVKKWLVALVPPTGRRELPRGLLHVAVKELSLDSARKQERGIKGDFYRMLNLKILDACLPTATSRS